jgi:tRNA-Thr(GGU) m(6)t(6)A37 methyltransferase TsaA
MKPIQYMPIGIIHSSFNTPEEAPIQPRLAKGARGRIELLPEYGEALADLESFSHIILIYHFHLAEKYTIKVRPPHEDSFHGVFATRVASRPNTIGISVVSLHSIKGTVLQVSNIDVVNGTPLLDIKPFIPSVDRQYGASLGWLADKYDTR